MRNALRTIFALAVVIVALGGLLTRPGTGDAGAPLLSAQDQAALRAVGSRLTEESPIPRYAYAAKVFSRISLNPDPEAPLGNAIEVSIETQRLTAWRDGKIVYRFKVSTARPGYHTPTGHFHVLDKASNWYSNQWSVWMPDALHFYGDYFIHALPYRSDPSRRIGGSFLGTANSHGCVRVGVADQHLLWTWAYVGMPVWVH